MSAARKGERNPCFGRKGERHPLFGKKHSDEAKLKMSAAGKKVWEIRSRPTKRMSKAGRAGSAEGKEKAGSAGGSAGGSAEDKEKVHQRIPSTERLWEVLGEGKGKGKRKGKGNVVMQRAWVLKGAKEYNAPFDYHHSTGAVIFVRVRQSMGPQ